MVSSRAKPGSEAELTASPISKGRNLAPAVAAMALAGAVLMPVSLFLDWYTVTTEDSRFTFDGWDVFESTDALMMLVGVATLALVVFRPRFAGRALLLAGALTSGWILVQVIDRPAALGFFGRSDVSLELGAWLGLLGALLILAAGGLSHRGHDRPSGA